MTKVTQRVSIELARNEAYWDKARVPKLEKLVLIPMPEATTRLAALRSGQVDWIEVPPPDAIPSLKAAGFQISLKEYPHLWPWVLSAAGDSPFKDKRVRLAINYAIDRDGLVQLLNGTAKPAIGFYSAEHPSFGKPEVRFNYDPAKAKALLKEAGFGPDKPVKAKIMISTSGSGQMMPIPMNEFLQQNLKDAGFDIEFDVVDWGTMLVAFRNPPTSPMSRGDHGVNISLPFGDPTLVFRFFHGSSDAAERIELGQLQQPEGRQGARPGVHDLRSGGAGQADRGGAHGARQRRRLALHRARPQSAGHEQQGERLRSRAELVSGADPGHR